MGEFKEAIITEICLPNDDREGIELILVVDEDADVAELRVDGKIICSGDWSGNFKKLFAKALKKWDEKARRR